MRRELTFRHPNLRPCIVIPDTLSVAFNLLCFVNFRLDQVQHSSGSRSHERTNSWCRSCIQSKRIKNWYDFSLLIYYLMNDNRNKKTNKLWFRWGSRTQRWRTNSYRWLERGSNERAATEGRKLHIPSWSQSYDEIDH